MSLNSLSTILNDAHINPVSIKHIESIILFSLAIAFVIFFLLFTFVFFTHQHLLKKEFEIKQKYNDFQEFIQMTKFKHLNNLVRMNKNLDTVINKLQNNKKLFNEQLMKINKKIKILTVLNSKYAYINSHKLVKEIEQDLKKCDIAKASLISITGSTNEYVKSVSDLLVSYRIIFNQIINFYEVNLSFLYNQVKFKEVIDVVEKTIYSITESIVKFNNEDLLVEFDKLNKLISNMYSIVMKIYIYDCLLTYARVLQKEINTSMRISELNLSSADLNSIEVALAVGNNNLKNGITAINSLDLNASKRDIFIAIKNFETAHINLSLSDRTNVLAQKDMKLLQGQLSIIQQELSELRITINSIRSNFIQANDVSVVKKIGTLESETKFLLLNYQSLEKEYITYKSIERNQFLNSIAILANKILNWKRNFLGLAAEIKKKYIDSINIIDQLTNDKLVILQLLNNELLSDKVNEKNINLIKTHFQQCDVLLEQLKSNYFKHYDNAKRQLNVIERDIDSLLTSFSNNDIFKGYAQRLIFFTNKYRNENTNISNNLTLAEQLYRKGEYQDAMNKLIKTLTEIKNSSKQSGIIFA
ncbi:MAG: septation ring formation regulator EzrA [Mycoplasmataceae bacterium]|jgi:hypothetical protein|nr:septation ring formation regulator EzrA [Mycoplasmataceae bacterium]